VNFSDTPAKITRYSYQVHASAMNASNRDVLLMVMHFEASSGRAPGFDLTYQREYFFSKNPLESGASETVDGSPSSFSGPIVNGVPSIATAKSTPEATVQVEFVQFSDGSTWGEPEAARDILKTRRASLRRLLVLQHTYEESGEQAFVDELSKEPLLPCVNLAKSACKDDGDYSWCALDRLRGMLDAARNHKRAMTSGSQNFAP